jgi:hypothetical protein
MRSPLTKFPERRRNVVEGITTVNSGVFFVGERFVEVAEVYAQ